MGNVVYHTCFPPLIYGRFHQVGGLTHNYPRDVDIMRRVDGEHWHADAFHDLHNEDALWAWAMVCSKGMGLRMVQKVNDYPILNQLIWMGINDTKGWYHPSRRLV